MSEKFSDYTKSIWENDNELYRVLSRREEYIKRQIKNSENYNKLMLDRINQELLDTQKSMMEVVDKMHENFDRWLNFMDKYKLNDSRDNKIQNLLKLLDIYTGLKVSDISKIYEIHTVDDLISSLKDETIIWKEEN